MEFGVGFLMFFLLSIVGCKWPKWESNTFHVNGGNGSLLLPCTIKVVIQKFWYKSFAQGTRRLRKSMKTFIYDFWFSCRKVIVGQRMKSIFIDFLKYKECKNVDETHDTYPSYPYGGWLPYWLYGGYPWFPHCWNPAWSDKRSLLSKASTKTCFKKSHLFLRDLLVHHVGHLRVGSVLRVPWGNLRAHYRP